jgi:ELWxxDGT repeat protein
LFRALGSQLLFATTDANQDRELWISGGTTGGTQRVRDLNPSTADAEVRDLIPMGSDLYFVADDGINGEAIWKADLSSGSADLVADVSPASTDRLSKLTLVEGASPQLVFYNNSLGTAGGVYVTDGDQSPLQLSDLRPVELDAEGTMFVVAGGWIYFVADDGTNGTELWKTDGVSQATMVADGVPGTAGSNPGGLVAFDGQLYFAADTSSDSPSGDIGRELFRTDGNTVSLAADVRPGAESSEPDQMTVAGGDLFFTADDGTNGRELWRHDGADGSLVEDLQSGSLGSRPIALTDVDGTLYFSADNGTDGYEPYRSDGTAAGTFQIADLHPGAGDSFPNAFFSALGEVYFNADDGSTGAELWKTDGAAGQASQVADLLAGGEGSDPLPLQSTGRRLIVAAAGSTPQDRELWATDGTAVGTRLIEDLYPSEFRGSDPQELIAAEGGFYFSAESVAAGRELFQMTEVAPSVSQVVIGNASTTPVEQQRATVERVTVTFEGEISVPDAALQLVNRDTGTTLDSVAVDRRFENGQTLIELTFGAGASVIQRDPGGALGLGNSLADGNYQLTILAGSVVAPVSGLSMQADFGFGTAATDRFFRLFGDVDGDRDVDGQDFVRFAEAFLQVAGGDAYDAALDLSGDGDIDGQDLAWFSQRQGRRLAFD